MAFDNKPQKFQTDQQACSLCCIISFRYRHALVATYPIGTIKVPIQNNWLLFIQELNNLFGEVNIEQTSKRALKCLKILNNHHINRCMTSSQNMLHTLIGMMLLFMMPFMQDLQKHSKISYSISTTLPLWKISKGFPFMPTIDTGIDKMNDKMLLPLPLVKLLLQL